MQITNIRKDFNVVTIAAGIALSSGNLLYSDSDQFSSISSVLRDHTTENYIQEGLERNPFIDKMKFDARYNSWKTKTIFASSAKEIVNQNDFQAIVQMGQVAVPFIVEIIEKEPSPLVWALNFIYGAKISNNRQLTITEACKLWVKALKN